MGRPITQEDVELIGTMKITKFSLFITFLFYISLYLRFIHDFNIISIILIILGIYIIYHYMSQSSKICPTTQKKASSPWAILSRLPTKYN